MNYLAHAYLSFNDPNLLLGNMISDFVKGKKQFDYPEKIQAGIKLHRAIDDFTDAHPATQEIKKYFRPAYRLYAGAFTDVVYDYFLANDETLFAEPVALKQFTENTYAILLQHAPHFPVGFAMMFPHMKAQDWLYNYRSDVGMQKAFMGLKHRAAYISEVETASRIFLSNKEKIKEHYNIFFQELKAFALRRADQLRKRISV